MRVTIDVDEGTWKELTDYVLKKHKKLYGKYRRNTVNDVLKLGLKALKRSNAGDFKNLIKNAEVSESFLKSSLEVSKEIRQRSVARVEMT
jgi:SPX domain protein involved in polyphosphate accumulation